MDLYGLIGISYGFIWINRDLIWIIKPTYWSCGEPSIFSGSKRIKHPLNNNGVTGGPSALAVTPRKYSYAQCKMDVSLFFHQRNPGPPPARKTRQLSNWYLKYIFDKLWSLEEPDFQTSAIWANTSSSSVSSAARIRHWVSDGISWGFEALLFPQCCSSSTL